MGKETVKDFPWEKVLSTTEDLSGIPRKQLDDVANQLQLGIKKVMVDNQPKKDGDQILVNTPFGIYTVERFGERNVKTPEGKTVVRPVLVGIASSVPREWIVSANIGLIDKATDAEEASKKKNAKSA